VLLCELHAHSTWSDGTLSLAALVDVYGNAGFDLLCVSDHALADGDPWLASQGTEARHVHAGNHAAYLRAIEEEAERARSLYGLLLVPGLEITCNDPDPVLAAHAVAVGLRSFVSPQVGIAAAMRAAREGLAIIAAHPHGEERDAFPLRTRHSASSASGTSSRRSSTGSSCSTATTSSLGSPRAGFRPSPAATSIARSISPPGRRFFPAPGRSRP
jgi:hypothetical protein